MKDLLIGIDCSTSACKTIIWNHHGERVSAGWAEIPLARPHSGWHEQLASNWWLALKKALKSCLLGIEPTRLAGLSISIQRETFVAVDGGGNALRPAILWMDTRAGEELQSIQNRLSLADFQQITGKRLSVNLLPPKLLWLQAHEPKLFEAIHQIWDVHAYLTHHLMGEAVASWGTAGPMGLFDLQRMEWGEEILNLCGLSNSHMPRLAAPGASIGLVSTAAAQETGLPVGLPVFAGLGDGQASGLGTGITQTGSSYLTLGTSVISGTFTPDFLVNDAFRTMVGGEQSSYLLETVLLGGTYTIDWFLKDFLQQPGTLQRLTAEAALLPPGAEGLTLLPYWNSAMNPYWDEKASGVMIGWRGIHRPAHVFRAILEGIAYELRLQSDGVADATGVPIERYLVMGGGAQSDLWCQIIADVGGRVVQRATEAEAAALGAAMLAGIGSGIFTDCDEAAAAMVKVSDVVFQPDPHRQVFYEQHYQQTYRPLYPALKEILGTLNSEL